MHDDHDEAVRRLAADAGVAVRCWAGTEGQPSAPAMRGRVRRGRLEVALPGVPRGLHGRAETAWLLALLSQRSAGAVLSGEVACHLLGLPRTRRDADPVLLARHGAGSARLPASVAASVRVVRSRRRPVPLLAADPCGNGVWPVAPLPRALADALARITLGHARALVGEALSGGRVGVRQLAHEVSASPRRSPVQETVLADLRAGGVWSVPEGALLDLVATSCVLPRPRTNALLVGRDGRALARPDALWEAAALAASVDSRQHHGDTAAWSRTLLRAAEAEACGVLSVHLTPEIIGTRGHVTLLGLERHWCARLGTASVQGLRVLDDAPARRRAAW